MIVGVFNGKTQEQYAEFSFRGPVPGDGKGRFTTKEACEAFRGASPAMTMAGIETYRKAMALLEMITRERFGITTVILTKCDHSSTPETDKDSI